MCSTARSDSSWGRRGGLFSGLCPDRFFGRPVAEFQGVSFIYPVERIVRDLHLASIWTGSNEVMSMIIASEWYKEYWKNKGSGKIRDLEADAAEAGAPDEKIFE